MKNINFLDLGTGYHLAGFADFEAAFEATDTLYSTGLKIAYLNEATHICETEVGLYASKIEKSDNVLYQDYLLEGEQFVAGSATESFRTALAALEALNQFKAKYIAVLMPKHSKAAVKQRW